MSTPQTELPLYRCHKVVRAAEMLLRQADEMAANAKTLRGLANAMGSMPATLGSHVITLAIALQRYDLCIVHREVLETAKAAIEAHDADEADHPQEAYRQQGEALQAIEQSLRPERWAGQAQPVEVAHG